MTGVQTCALPICFPVTIKRWSRDVESTAKASKGKTENEGKAESTAKALSEISKTEIDKNRSIKNAEKIDEISEAYHKAKEDGIRDNER